MEVENSYDTNGMVIENRYCEKCGLLKEGITCGDTPTCTCDTKSDKIIFSLESIISLLKETISILSKEILAELKKSKREV